MPPLPVIEKFYNLSDQSFETDLSFRETIFGFSFFGSKGLDFKGAIFTLIITEVTPGLI